MPEESVAKLAAIPDVEAVSPQVYLATLVGASCCSASEMFMIAYDPATDFTVRPWLEQQLPAGLARGEVIGGDYISATEGKDGILVYGTLVHLKGNLQPTGTGLDQSLLFTLDTAKSIALASYTQAEKPLVIPEKQVSAVLVKTRPGTNTEKIAVEMMRRVPGIYPIASANLFQSSRLQLKSLLNSVVIIMGLIWPLSILLIGMVYLMAANERRRELGMLRGAGRYEALYRGFAAARGEPAGPFRRRGRHLPCGARHLPVPALHHGVPGHALPAARARLAGHPGGARAAHRDGHRVHRRTAARDQDQPAGPCRRDARVEAAVMIVLDSVTKVYDLGKGSTVHAVRGVSLEIHAGEFTAIVGRSGSGKTTVLNLAAALTRPTSGRVTLDGVDLWRLNDTEQSRTRNSKIGFVFQFPSLLPTLTVLENVMLPTTFGAKRDTAAVRDRAKGLLERVGLTDKLNVYPRQLSAGQQQRVVIARSLINEPEVLLADEPTSNLDERTEAEIVDLFRDLHRSLGLTIVLVTHTRQIVSNGMRTIEMAEGKILEAVPALS